MLKISSANSGNEFSISLTFSGHDGERSTCPHCSHEESGKTRPATCGRVTLSSSAAKTLARITKAQADQDGKVCKVELVTAKEGSMRHYQRPVTEAMLLKAVQ